MSRGRTGSHRKKLKKNIAIAPGATPAQIQETMRRGQQSRRAQTEVRIDNGRPARETDGDRRRAAEDAARLEAFAASSQANYEELLRQGWRPLDWPDPLSRED
jgi:hypothetical protein